jgi:hypothetical protein
MWGSIGQAIALAQGVFTPSHQSIPSNSHVELYTGPYTSGGAWASAYDHAVDLVSQMTLEEKVSYLHLM